MQETTRRRNGHRHIHSESRQSNTCEAGGTNHQRFGQVWDDELQQFEWLWSTQTRSIFRPGTSGLERDIEMQAAGQEAPAKCKRSAETDAESLQEEVTSAEADSNKRLALNRKAEGDPDDGDVENSVMNSLAELWREDNDPTLKSTRSFFSSVIDTLQACMRLALISQCVRNQRYLSHMMNADGITSMTRVASCAITLLSRKRVPRKFLSFASLVSGRF